MSLYSALTQVLAPFAAKIKGIQTGYDGTEYTSPGEAVREQINDLHILIGDVPGTAIQASAVAYNDSDVGTELTNVNGRLQWYPLAVNVTDGSYVVGSTGGIDTNANLSYAEVSVLAFRGKGITIQSYLWEGAGFAFLDVNGAYIYGESANTKGITPEAGVLTKVETSVPYNAYSLRVTLHQQTYAANTGRYFFTIGENKATKVVFIGDSYGTGFNTGGTTTGWIPGTATALGLKSSDFESHAKGGAGFRHPANEVPNETFTDLLNLSTLAKADVGKIVVCGGYNEQLYTVSQLLEAFGTFAAKAREKYPFAEICIGMIGHSGTASGQETLMNTVRQGYMQMANRAGVRYLSNVEYVLTDDNVSSDGIHPDQAGATALGTAIGNAVKTGSASGKNYGSVIDEIDGRLHEVSSAVDDVIGTEIISTILYQKESGTESLPEGCSTTLGYLRHMGVQNSGNLNGTSSEVNKTFWVQANEDMNVYLISGAQNKSICIFEGAPYGASYRATPVYSSSTPDTYPLPTAENPVHVEAGQYITFSYYNGPSNLSTVTWTLYKVEKGGASIKQTVPLTDTQAAEVDSKIKNVTDELLEDGLFALNPNICARNAWASYSTTDSRAYRVRIKDDVTFAYDCYVLMDPGFMVDGYSEEKSLSGPFTTLRLKANVKYHLYIRRVTEDTSETADIEEFAASLKFSTSLAPIEMYKPTFTDVSMFPRIGICGDSYASGGGIISGVRPLTWGKCLERQTGVTVDIYAKSGQNVMQWVVDSTNGLPALLAGEECGMYWLQHGINGTGTDELLGTAADMSANPRPSTFYGQYTEAVMQIKEHFPYARIILATIVGSSWAMAYTYSRYIKANEAIRAIAEYCEVPCIETASDDFYRTYFYSNYIRSNHPTAMQNAGVAMANRRLISKCIQENPDYFVNFGSNW